MFFEQNREVERAVGVAALIRSPVGGLGGCQVAVLFEQHTEIGRGGAVSKPVGSLVGRHRSHLVAMLFEQKRVCECAIGVVRPSGIRTRGYRWGGCCCLVGGWVGVDDGRVSRVATRGTVGPRIGIRVPPVVASTCKPRRREPKGHGKRDQQHEQTH